MSRRYRHETQGRDNNGSTHPPTHETITDPRIHHWDPPLGSTIQCHIRTSTTEPTHARAATPRRDHATRCPNPAAADSDAKKRPPPLALRAAIPTRPPPASRCPTPEQRAPPRYCIPRPELSNELPENEKCGDGGATWKTGADGTADRSRRGRTRPRAAASPGSTGIRYPTAQPMTTAHQPRARHIHLYTVDVLLCGRIELVIK